MLVLDGQQRLQSLFIGLKGSYDKRELCLDVLSGDLVAPEDIRYKFKFLPNTEIKAPWFKLKDIVFSNEKFNKIADLIKSKFETNLDEKNEERINDIVAKIVQIFGMEDNLVYQVVDSIDNLELYKEDEFVIQFMV